MWERWKQGDSLHQIAQLFDRNHSSIQQILDVLHRPVESKTDGVEKVWRQYSKCIVCHALSRQTNQSHQKAGGTGAATT